MMRILYLLYAPQKPFSDSGNIAGSRFPWSDTLIDKLSGIGDLTLALAVPIIGGSFQKRIENRVVMFGLPIRSTTSITGRFFRRYAWTVNDFTVNEYASRAIEDFKPDIIQVFGTENPFGLLAGQHDIPLVIHIQGILMVWSKKWFTGISGWEQIKFSSLKDLLTRSGSYGEFSDFSKRALREEEIMKRCTYYMGRTGFDERIVSLLSPEAKYFHCEEFIRSDFFRSEWELPLGNVIRLVSILKGTTYKGIDLLIELLIKLKKYSEREFSLVICGVSSKEEVVRILKRKYRKYFKGLNIDFAGRLSTPDLVKQLAGANFYIHPSYIENSPNSVCEAMALGMPVISTNVGGTGSLISDRVDGLLVQEGEPYALAAAVMNLTNNYDYAKLLGKNARIRSFARHDPEQIMNRLITIYKTIAEDYDRK